MAKNKEKEVIQLKKGKSEFVLIGKAKVNERTFQIDVESKNSDWMYNRLNLGVDCGADGVIYASMMGGFGTERENKCFVHGTKPRVDKDGKELEGHVDDFSNQFEIAWEDRKDEEILKTVGEMCFIKIGLHKDDNDKTIVHKFISQYDAIEFLQENLEEGMVINVKGNLVYQEYNGNLTVNKEITSIFLSKAEDEEDFKATFFQTMILNADSIGKVDKETRRIPITGQIVELFRTYNGKELERINPNSKSGKSKGQFLPIPKTFEFEVGEDLDKAKKMLKIFKVKSKKKANVMTIEGKFSRGAVNTVTITEKDLPDDIKELVELGFIDLETAIGQMASANNQGSAPEIMIITKPRIYYREENEMKIPTVDKQEEVYDLEDLILEQIIEESTVKANQEEDSTKEHEDEDGSALDKLLNGEDDDEDDGWLTGLDE